MAERVLHVADRPAWEAAAAAGRPYEPASLAAEGFVHCSTEAQLPATLRRHFAGADPDAHVVLVLDPTRLPVRWEAAPDAGGEAFPHVYGPITPDSVVAVRPLA